MAFDRSRVVVTAGAPILFGLALGLGVFTFGYAEGHSYLTDDPAACANCHVMSEQYDAWQKSAHQAVATCNDCHTPEGLVPKYTVKAINGFNHALAFTTGNFHEPIQITGMNREVAQEACTKCHDTLVHPLRWGADDGDEGGELPSCVHCHGSIGHPR